MITSSEVDPQFDINLKRDEETLYLNINGYNVGYFDEEKEELRFRSLYGFSSTGEVVSIHFRKSHVSKEKV